MVKSFCERFDAAAQNTDPRHVFLSVDGQPIFYKDFLTSIRQLWGFFNAHGLKRGDRVGIASRDAGAVSAVVLAGIRYGLSVVSVNPQVSPRELTAAEDGCRLSWFFLDKSLADKPDFTLGCGHTVIGPQATRKRPGLVGRILRPRVAGTGLEAALAEFPPYRETPPPLPNDASGLMLFTSGTTKAPKIVELSHGNISAQLSAIEAVFGYSGQTRLLNPLPLHFTDGLFHGPLAAFCFGASLYRPAQFDVGGLEELLHSVYRERITHFIVVPAILALMERLGEAFSDAFDSEDFELIRSSGDILPEPLWRGIERRFGVPVVNTYGMSESSCEAFFCGPQEETKKIGSIGKPVLCEAKIERDPGGSGEGELLLRGPLIMKGYFGQPELTSEVLSDGWLRTGDIARIDEEGFAWIVGRRKNLIISGGTNIHPQEVTDVLLSHPKINDAVTFGIPHSMWGEQVACAIILHENAVLDRDTVLDFCRQSLAPQKCPRLVRFVETFPRNAAGKVRIDELAAALAPSDLSAGSEAETRLGERILSIAAMIFRTPEETLRLSSGPSTVPGWDSLAHLELVVEIERNFGIRLAARDILSIESLDDVVRLVTDAEKREPE